MDWIYCSSSPIQTVWSSRRYRRSFIASHSASVYQYRRTLFESSAAQCGCSYSHKTQHKLTVNRAGGQLAPAKAVFLWCEDYTEEKKEERVSNQVEAAPRTHPYTNQCLFNKHVFVVSVCKGSCFTGAAPQQCFMTGTMCHTAIKLKEKKKKAHSYGIIFYWKLKCFLLYNALHGIMSVSSCAQSHARQSHTNTPTSLLALCVFRSLSCCTLLSIISQSCAPFPSPSESRPLCPL